MFDLVADGLITMYVEANAKDYIDHMSFDVPTSPMSSRENSYKEVSTVERKFEQVALFILLFSLK